MGNETKTVDIVIGERPYSLRGGISVEEARELERYLNSMIRMVNNGTLQPISIDRLLLVALNCGQDTMKMKEERDLAIRRAEKIEKRLEDYGKLWDKARDGFKQANDENVKLIEDQEELDYEIKRLNREIRDLKKDLRELKKENKVLKSRLGEDEQGEEDVLAGQIQLRLPPNL